MSPLPAENYTGLKYGKLTILKRVYPANTYKGKVVWLARCECGTEFLITPYRINQRKITACAECRAKERKGD